MEGNLRNTYHLDPKFLAKPTYMIPSVDEVTWNSIQYFYCLDQNVAHLNQKFNT